jgi:hypothetical protein
MNIQNGGKVYYIFRHLNDHFCHLNNNLIKLIQQLLFISLHSKVILKQIKNYILMN